MNTKEIFLNALADINKDGLPFSVQIHCVVNEAMEIPEAVRAQNPNQIMFRLSSDLSPNIFYDFDSRTFSFDCTFSHNPTRVYMNLDNIAGVVDDLDNSTMMFGSMQEQVPTQVRPAPAPQAPKVERKVERVKSVPKPQALFTKKHLSLVVDNT